jgi:hypothetical protein
VGQARNKSGIKVENILTKGKCIFIEITKNHTKKIKKKTLTKMVVLVW